MKITNITSNIIKIKPPQTIKRKNTKTSRVSQTCPDFDRAKEMYGRYTVNFGKNDNRKRVQCNNLCVNEEYTEEIVRLSDSDYEKAVLLLRRGIADKDISLFLTLNDEEFKKAEEYISKGYPPYIAANYAKFSKEQIKFAQELKDKGADSFMTILTASGGDEERAKILKLLDKYNGCTYSNMCDMSNIDETGMSRLDELFYLNAGEENIPELAALNENDYQTAIQMINEGNMPPYVLSHIISQNNSYFDNSEYLKYVKMGYGYNSAISLAEMDADEIKTLLQFKQKNPEIKELLENNYDAVVFQLEDSKDSEVIFSKQLRCQNGTLITLVRTFDKNGAGSKSRLEEYPDGTSSSFCEKQDGLFKIKYGKCSEIKEMFHYIPADDENGGIKGVIHTIPSDILPGAFESVYYPIEDMKDFPMTVEESMQIPFSDAVKTQGIPISSVHTDSEGRIIYDEKSTYNGFTTTRKYVTSSSFSQDGYYTYYKYQIEDKCGNKLTDIEKEFRKNDDGSSDNNINGISYHISYNDDDKTINISDGKKSKTLKFNDILPYYGGETLWNKLKFLQADELLNISQNVSHWFFDYEGEANYQFLSMRTSTNKPMILHETAHLISDNNPSITKNRKLRKIYNKEMQDFFKKIPFNEQEIIMYFSPRSGLTSSDGIEEFNAESNVLLSTYGNCEKSLSARCRFLAQYFPETIAAISELTGKNSKRSLLK